MESAFPLSTRYRKVLLLKYGEMARFTSKHTRVAYQMRIWKLQAQQNDVARN